MAPVTEREVKREILKLEKQGLLSTIVIAELEKKLMKIEVTNKQLKEIIDETIKAYNAAQVEPGEGVGTVAAQSIGEPGTQMSLPHNELVIIRRGDQSETVQIGDFVNDLIEKLGQQNEITDPFGSTIYDIPGEFDLLVPGLCANEKIRWHRLVQVSRHPPNGDLIRITTRSGRQITATFSHSFVVRKNNSITPIKGKELKLGDRIPLVIYLTTENPLNSLPLERYLTKNEVWYGSELAIAPSLGAGWGEAYGNECTIPVQKETLWKALKTNKDTILTPYHVYPKEHHSSYTRIPEIIELNFLNGWFMGAYLAEGSSATHFISISNTDVNYQKRVVDFAQSMSVNSYVMGSIGEYGPSSSIIISSSVLAKLFQRMCGSLSHTKQVPSWVLNANEEFIAGLLRGYFDGDGNINISKRTIRVSTCSKQLRDGICLLLSRLGIFSTKSDRDQYHLTIPGRYAIKFRDLIGSDIASKLERLNQLAAREEAIMRDDEKTYDLLDMIPGFGKLFDALKYKLQLPSRLTTKLSRKQKVGRRALGKYIKHFEDDAKKLGVNIDKELGILQQAYNSDVLWDEIVKLESVSPESEFVYDFSVPELETFITAEGLVTHNTLRTFHYAGVAEFNVTLGLPRLIEILDARRNPSTPTMTVYLLPEYRKDRTKALKVARGMVATKVSSVAKEIQTNVLDSQIVILLDKELMDDKDVNSKVIAKHLKGSRTFKAAEFTVEPESVVMKFQELGLDKLQKLREKVKSSLIKGVKGIKRAVMRRDKVTHQWVIHTQGTNLVEVMKVDGVDKPHTKTNNIQEIASVLGIEAARNAIIEEAMNVLEEQGLDVDIRHIMLVSDIMTATGEVRQIGRHGISGQKGSVLARASFEVTVKHLLNASIRGEEDDLKGIAENVIVGQMIPLGTGTVDLRKSKAGKRKIIAKKRRTTKQKTTKTNTTEK